MAMHHFEVTPDGGDPYRVSTASRDVLQWERTTKGASLSDLLARPNMTDLYKLAWLASKREGHFGGTVKDFEDRCELELVDAEDEEPDPTQPAP